jgi:cell division protein ZapA (FtsZ GTPase activity inhibitor)
MQIRPSHSLFQYLVLALVLSAIFLAIMYTADLKPTYDPEPEAAITSTAPVVRSPRPDSTEQRYRQLEQRLGQVQGAYEARLKKLEQRLAQTPSQGNGGTDSKASPPEAKLQLLEQKLGQIRNAYEARFVQLEQRLVQTTAPNDERLQKIEARLAQTTSRLDELSVALAALTDDANTIVAANQALRIAPPATQNASAASAPQTRPQPGASTAIASGKRVIPATPPGDNSHGAGTGHREGKWAINLASYLSEKTAARKMASFQKKGVTTEMVATQVQGRTIYRVRLARFFDTLEAARSEAPAVEAQLGLKETWVMAN